MDAALRRITAEADPGLGALERWYREAIPEVERIPWRSLVRLAIGPAWLFEVRSSEDKPVGLAFAHVLVGEGSSPSLTYLQYLVIDAAQRGGGIGAQAYRAVRDVLPPTAGLILEVEDPARCPEGQERDLAHRRIQFYARLGLRLLDVPYVQPPASPGLPAWPMRLMLDPHPGPVEESGAVALFTQWLDAWPG